MADASIHSDAVFNAARRLADPAARDAYLDQACAGDAALRRQVEGLLKAHEAAGSFMDSPPDDPSWGAATVQSVEPPLSERPGSVIGRYKLLEQLGEGGMGVVFLAEQSQPVRREVALKVIKAGMDTRQVVARFEAERQALAMMDHVNIARVLDAGATESGRPYFVMELVRGVPITRYCDDNHLTPRQRLELFVPVCQAIQHAHTKGIIHRDIKPSNVMVTLYDGKPVAKVIDFGVAKAVEQKLTDRTLFTHFGMMVGTLEYMSPEQAEMSALGVDTRSDIYSLGVLLYELLTGSTPLGHKRLREAAHAEILRMIKEEEPPKPSTRLSDSAGDALASISARRHTEPAKLTKLMRGELDWIAMKSLEKDRNRRYETANGFAADVQRYLNDETVQACPPSAGYRFRKLARRHRGPVAAAGLVLLALVGGITGTTWGLLRAELQRRLAEAKTREVVQERDFKDAALKAEQQARADEAKARQQAFAALRSMTADAIEKKFTQGAAVTEGDRAFLRGVIAQYDAFAAIRGDDTDSRAVRAEGRYRVGTMRHRMGELLEAERDLDQAVSLYEQLSADFHDRPEFREELANAHNARGFLFRDTGRPAEAEQDYDRALDIQKQLVADVRDRPELRHQLAMSHNNRAVLLEETGRPRDAVQDYDRAVALYEQLAAESTDRPQVRHQLAGTRSNRGILLQRMGRPREAEQDYDRGVTLYKQLIAEYDVPPAVHHSLAVAHNNRGDLLRDTGRPGEAEQEYNRALSILKPLAADFHSRPDFRHELANSHNKLGGLCMALGRLKEAQDAYAAALALTKQLAADFPNRPDEPSLVAVTLGNMANLCLRQREFGRAKAYIEEAAPYHESALKANSRHSDYRRFYRNHLSRLASAHAGLLEPQHAVRTAETCRDLGWDAPADAYNAACFLARCIPVVAEHDKLDANQRKQSEQFYGEAAMKLLRTAVGKGYRDAAHLLKDADLDPLRQRADFEKLITDLGPAASDRTRSYLRLGQRDTTVAWMDRRAHEREPAPLPAEMESVTREKPRPGQPERKPD